MTLQFFVLFNETVAEILIRFLTACNAFHRLAFLTDEQPLYLFEFLEASSVVYLICAHDLSTLLY